MDSSEGSSDMRLVVVRVEIRRPVEERGEGEKVSSWSSMLAIGSSGHGSELVSELNEVSAS
jgi:hypothetical protein